MADERKQNPVPNFLSPVKLQYVKLGYHYLISNAMNLLLLSLLGIASARRLSTFTLRDFVQLLQILEFDLVSVVSVTLCSSLLVFLGTLYFMSRPRKVYLVNFACYKPERELMCSWEGFAEMMRSTGHFSEENLAFQNKILERSGLGQKTYLPKSFKEVPINQSMVEARKEMEAVLFGAIDELLEKTRLKTQDIGILVVNCGNFSPTPSLSAMIVNHYKLRGNILTYNLGGMGCSAGIISIDLAKKLLEVGHNTLPFSLLINCHVDACMCSLLYHVLLI